MPKKQEPPTKPKFKRGDANGSGFIQDNSDQAFHLTDKLTNPIF